MKRYVYLAIFGISFGALALVSNAATASAATSTSTNAGQALEIAPPVITLSAKPGQTVQVQISLRDISSGSLVVDNAVNDFVAGGEDGTPKILMDNNGDTNPYSLKSWINPIASLLLAPHQIKTLNVTIKVPADATPGGHYGVIRFTAAPSELHTTGVSLSASLGSLIMINVSGNTKESLAMSEFSVNKNGKTASLFESTPITFTERIKNSGNVFEEPTGQIAITDMFGKKIANVNVNLQSHNILPQSIRRFDVPLDSAVIGNRILFGLYHAKLHMTYGASKQILTANLDFWIIPYRLIAFSIILLVGGFFVLRHLIRHYNRRIIAKATKSKK